MNKIKPLLKESNDISNIIKNFYFFILLAVLVLVIYIIILVLNLIQITPNKKLESLKSNNIPDKLKTIITTIQSGQDKITLNRIILNESNNQCGYTDPCYTMILEEIFDRITNQTYLICRKIPKPLGTPCITSCISIGKCTGFIGSSESNSDSKTTEPYCNVTSPFNCYGYCNNYLDCLPPNLLKGKATSASFSPGSFAQIVCIANSCVYTVKTRDSVSGYGALYPWLNKPDLLNPTVSPFPQDHYFGYGANFCEYILYDKLNSNELANVSSNIHLPRNNKGCFDYSFGYVNYDDPPFVNDFCIYQYKCSRPLYLDSIQPRRFSPTAKKKRNIEKEEEIQQLCKSILTITYFPPSVSEVNNSVLMNVVTNNDLEEFLKHLREKRDDLILSSLEIEDIESFVMNNCIQNTFNGNSSFILKPRTVIELTEDIKNEIKNSFIYVPKIGYMSLPSQYTAFLQNQNITSFGELQEIMANNTRFKQKK